jgi:hypothetical protein
VVPTHPFGFFAFPGQQLSERFERINTPRRAFSLPDLFFSFFFCYIVCAVLDTRYLQAYYVLVGTSEGQLAKNGKMGCLLLPTV